MLNYFDDIQSKFLIDFDFNINNDYNLKEIESTYKDEDESIFKLKDNLFLDENINLFSNDTINNSESQIKKIFTIDKCFINKKKYSTKLHIESLLDLNLNSYEVNHIIKLIKTAWISGIYSLINKNLNNLFIKNLFKVEGFVFEFFYIKTSLIETDNTEENLNIFNISIKDLLTGNVVNKNNCKEVDKTRVNNINNNLDLINYLNQIIGNIIYDKDEETIEIIKKILLILEKKISFFANALWKDPEECNEIENEFKNYCNKKILINKFKKSKEIIKIIINKVENDYPKYVKEVEIKNKLERNSQKDYNYLNKLEQNNIIKSYINEIVEKILEISKKEKFENYFNKKKQKKKLV